MSRLPFTARRRTVLALSGASLALLGCAGLQGPPGCPDVAGTYANQAEGSRQRLSALLLPEGAGNAARTVTLSLAGEPQRLVVAAGAQHAALEPGQDFTCESGALRLAEPSQRRINLGSFLTQDVETMLILSKDADAGLVAKTSTREHSVIWGKSVTSPVRPGAVLHWKAVAAPQAR
jgi:hypothetical protein